jgi:hypothetical protein
MKLKPLGSGRFNTHRKAIGQSEKPAVTGQQIGYRASCADQLLPPCTPHEGPRFPTGRIKHAAALKASRLNEVIEQFSPSRLSVTLSLIAAQDAASAAARAENSVQALTGCSRVPLRARWC